MVELAPIVLFVYNRIEHTRQAIAALQNNFLASESDLIIYSDAAKTDIDIVLVTLVREYLKTISGFKSILIVERQSNLGLARSIIDGVSYVSKKYGKVIVLEDDLVTSRFFLKYMNEALMYYRDQPKVMNINAYAPPNIGQEGVDVFFTRIPFSWGWATWADRWSYFNREIDVVISSFGMWQKHQFDFESSFPFYRTILKNRNGTLNTWAIFWYATLFLQGGLSLSPSKSYVINIGHDGSGVNSKKTKHLNGNLVELQNVTFSNEISESREFFLRLKKFYLSVHRGPLTIVYMRLLRFYRFFFINFLSSQE